MEEKYENDPLSELDDLMNGKIELSEDYDSVVDDKVENSDDINDNGNDSLEDTEQDRLSDDPDNNDDAQTNDSGDGHNQDSDEDIDGEDEDDSGENAQDSSDGKDTGSEKQSTDGEDQAGEESGSDESDGAEKTGNEGEDADNADKAGKPDIDATEYERYKSFYEKATRDFKANGKMVKGITDPEKVIQRMQMSAGMNHKLANFKKGQPFIKTLENEGLIDNPEQFNLLLDAKKGNVEAIKSIIKMNNIEVDSLIDNDFGDSGSTDSYVPNNHIASRESMIVDDLVSDAKMNGVEDKFVNELGNEWANDGSMSKIIEDPAMGKNLITHMTTKVDEQNTIYDNVVARVREKEMYDDVGYGNKNMVDKYSIALRELSNEKDAELADAQSVARDGVTNTVDRNSDAMRSIEVAKQKVLNKIRQNSMNNNNNVKPVDNSKVDDARKRATSLSSPKRKAKTVTKVDQIDNSMKLEGDDLMDYFNKNIMGRSY